MFYQCPKCDRYGMEWGGCAKVLLCYFKDCNHVIRIKGQKSVPTDEQIKQALKVGEQQKLQKVNKHYHPPLSRAAPLDK